jgi:hypothetical protein
MGNSQSSIQKINFEDMQSACKNPEIYLLINTLPDSEQGCLIIGSVNAGQEEAIINKHLRGSKNIQIIVYGRNCNDDKVFKKYQQLQQLGFFNVFIYSGGLFEWLMLQDIYGFNEFPTTTKQMDLLKYKPRQKLNVGLLECG